ncbi:hypothetical protein F4677DRAFT_460786 [Hypoxylon crocopeplum]|nr:hypothetical protein F4677DRAFT_460786 [Hypoxylon crocopeplum]
MADYPSFQQGGPPTDYEAGDPRDQQVAWSPYDRAPMHPPVSHQAAWPGYPQPYGPQSVSSQYGGVSHAHGQDFANGSSRHQLPMMAGQNDNQAPDSRMQAENWHRRDHRSRRLRSEPPVGVPPFQQQPRRRHEDAYRPELDEEDNIPERQDFAMPNYQGAGAYWNSNVASDEANRQAQYTNTSARTLLPGTKKTHGHGRHRSSRKERRNAPIPPEAPRIPRLPTPDLDVVGCGRHDPEDHEFCACCSSVAGGTFGAQSGRGECAKAKMERQLYEAKTYIAQRDPRDRREPRNRSPR